MSIKPIETIYNGYRFRSRLEARWAVFFDALGIEYQYEPEGLVLNDGTWYLPDFYLPHFKCYFEVKRKDVKESAEGKEAIDCIAQIGNDYNFPFSGIIAFGDPVDDDMTIYCYEIDEGGGGVYESQVTIGIHPKYAIPYIFSYNDRRERAFMTDSGEAISYIDVETACYGKYSYSDFVTSNVLDAREKARQARFEHGESPVRIQPLDTNKLFIDTKKEMITNFINKYKSKDCAFGGKENLCKIETIKKYWKEMYGTEDICIGERHIHYIQAVNEYFREAKKELICLWKEKGAEKEDLRRLGISEQMINKYWDK